MARQSAKEIALVKEYSEEVGAVAENLAFVLDNVGVTIPLDYSSDSLAALEKLFWSFHDAREWSGVIEGAHFAQLLMQYMTACVLRHADAKLVASMDKNPMKGQPCIELLHGKKHDRIYPVQLALKLPNLRRTNPSFPGLPDMRVAAIALERAVRLSPKLKK